MIILCKNFDGFVKSNDKNRLSRTYNYDHVMIDHSSVSC